MDTLVTDDVDVVEGRCLSYLVDIELEAVVVVEVVAGS